MGSVLIRGQGQVRKSLETSDPAVAERKAHEVWFEASYRVRNGLKVEAASFSKVAEDYIKLLENEVQRGERAAYHGKSVPAFIPRYLIVYFGDKDVDAISERDVEAYLEWRKAYWITGSGKEITEIRYERKGRSIRRPLAEKGVPTISRQRGELVVLRQIFRQAIKWGFLNKGQVPEIPLERAKAPNNRPSFSPEEFQRLVSASLQRLSDPTIHEHLRWDRTILHAKIMIAAYSGMRPAELNNLNWSDVIGYREARQKHLQERDIALRVYGKGKNRTFVAQEAALPWFDILWQFWTDQVGREPSDHDRWLQREVVSA